eukprot:c11765_g1_i2.p1 GENE.c11765_g1_i2~~c11765_g1_i2.p1  ORF type:complete len:490 (-),score=78.74 c11765_g1_i2:16-1275(-)
MTHLTGLFPLNPSVSSSSNTSQATAPMGGFIVVDQDGSPSGDKTIAIWNPSLVSKQAVSENGPVRRRESSLVDASRLMCELIKKGIRTLTFVKVRTTAELIIEDMKKRLPPDLSRRVACYRAGYLAEHRRGLEAGLSSGELLGVVATNALELGVDIGGLDATLHVGFPGTINSLWQQVGRCGRRHQSSISIMIALDSPLDQLFAAQPSVLWERQGEAAVANPCNVYLLSQHISAAAFELPLALPQQPDDCSPQQCPLIAGTPHGLWADTLVGGFHYPCLQSSLNEARESGVIVVKNQEVFCVKGKSPAKSISLRNVDPTTFELIDERTGVAIETTDRYMAFLRVHEGAVYMHQGESFVVTELDLAGNKAKLRRRTTDYFTRVQDHGRVIIQTRTAARHLTELPHAPLLTYGNILYTKSV